MHKDRIAFDSVILFIHFSKCHQKTVAILILAGKCVKESFKRFANPAE